MTTIKTEISIQDSLYEQIDRLAQEMQISQSELFALAAQDYLRRRQNQALLQSIEAAYSDGLDSTEVAVLEGMRRHQRHLVQDQ